MGLLLREVRRELIMKKKKYFAGFSFSACPLANASVKTDGRVTYDLHSPVSLASGIFISSK